MGRVLLAHDPVLDRDVAVKLLRDDLTIPPEQRVALIERMRQEARASARVSHPNIVALHDMGEDPELGLYLVFEYVEGLTLKERLTRGPLPPQASARLAREIGDAITTAHAAGVLHRDVKPENIILSPTGAKVADFGIARVPDSTLTRDGGLLGTPAYSAPECIATGTFSPLSDQFSFAATLYEAISGRRAFPGEDAVAVATKITTDEPLGIAYSCGVDPHVDAVLMRGLAKEAPTRYSSAREFAQALAEALERSPRNALPTLPDQQHRNSFAARDHRGARMAVGGAAVGALLGIAGFQLSTGLREPEPNIIERADSRERDHQKPVAWITESPRAPKPRSAATRAGDSKRSERAAASAHKAEAAKANVESEPASQTSPSRVGAAGSSARAEIEP
jgi:serine/threonine-protein kinase